MEPAKQEQTIHLEDYYRILIKHKWIIISSLISIVVMTLFFSFMEEPTYKSSATLVIDKELNTASLGEQYSYDSYASQSLTFNTHFKLISSNTILEQVIKHLELDQPQNNEKITPGLLTGFISTIKENIRLIFGIEKKKPGPLEKMTGLIKSLKNKIDIEEVRDTRLLRVNVCDHDPDIAKNLANSIAMAYIKFNIENRLKFSQNTMSWMTGQFYEMKKKLEDSEMAFLNYKEREHIFSIEGKQKVIMQKIEEFNDAYIKIRNKRLETDARLEQLKQIVSSKKNILQARSLVANTLIDNLYAQLLDKEVEMTGLNKVFKSKHPKFIQTRSTINKIRKKIQEEIAKEIENIKADSLLLSTRENVLQKTIAEFETDALDTNRKELQYAILSRNVQTHRKLYDTLLAKIKECNVMEEMDVSNIRITEPAVTTFVPVKPNKKRNFILSIILGLMTGVGIAFFMEYMDRSIRTEDDVQRYLGLPVLSVIPVADSKKTI